MNNPNPQQTRYIEYIQNTGQKPLPIADFDEDWEPIGEMVRKDLAAAGLIYYGGEGTFLQPPGIYLRPDLERTDDEQ